MPQTNLFFFDLISLGLIVFYLGGYGLFFKYVLPRWSYSVKTNWLNFLVLTEGYSFFLESSLFIVLFTLLLLLVTELVPTSETETISEFVLTKVDNPFEVQLQLITEAAGVLYHQFNCHREDLFGSAYDLVDQAVLKMLDSDECHPDELLAEYHRLSLFPFEVEIDEIFDFEFEQLAELDEFDHWEDPLPIDSFNEEDADY